MISLLFQGISQWVNAHGTLCIYNIKSSELSHRNTSYFFSTFNITISIIIVLN
jgi:hypothetical protein